MKLTMEEVRAVVAETIRQNLAEAKGKKKVLPPRSEEAVSAQRERQIRATGYAHSDQNDYSQPLGTASIVKKQGASGMGGWTKGSDPRPPAYGKPGPQVEQQLRAIIQRMVAEELRAFDKK